MVSRVLPPCPVIGLVVMLSIHERWRMHGTTVDKEARSFHVMATLAFVGSGLDGVCGTESGSRISDAVYMDELVGVQQWCSITCGVYMEVP
jgi:hypothetical protein